MNTVTTHDIFAFLTGDPPQPGSGAALVKDAVLNPGKHAEVDAALVQFRAMHKETLGLPKAKTLVIEHLTELNAQILAANAILSQSSLSVLPEVAGVSQPRASWKDLFDRLLTRCRQMVTEEPTAEANTGEHLASRIISTYIRGNEAGKYAELRDPQKLWPVLLELAAKKLKKPLTPELVQANDYTAALEDVLMIAFSKEANDEASRYVLAHNLLGKDASAIAEKTNDLTDNVSAVIQLLHSKFHLLLANAA